MGSDLWILLLQMTPRICGGVDGPEMYELLSGSSVVCVDGLVKGNDMSLLMEHMFACCICICDLGLL